MSKPGRKVRKGMRSSLDRGEKAASLQAAPRYVPMHVIGFYFGFNNLISKKQVTKKLVQ